MTSRAKLSTIAALDLQRGSNIMFTRQDYLNDVCTHQQYYGQFVNSTIAGIVLRSIGEKTIAASTDLHFNDIDLALWDQLYYAVKSNVDPEMLSLTKEQMTLGTAVCIAKSAAKAIIASQCRVVYNF